MSPRNYMKNMLDELMGANRDFQTLDKSLNFEDDNICKSYLVGFCPYKLFQDSNTDFGHCNLIHNASLKFVYERESQLKFFGYEAYLLRDIKKILTICDEKIIKNVNKLQETRSREDYSDEAGKLMDKNAEIGECVSEIALSTEYGTNTAPINLKLRALCAEKILLENNYRHKFSDIDLNKTAKLQVCFICSANFNYIEPDKCNFQRLKDHFEGKNHISFSKLRKMLVKTQKIIDQNQQFQVVLYKMKMTKSKSIPYSINSNISSSSLTKNSTEIVKKEPSKQVVVSKQPVRAECIKNPTKTSESIIKSKTKNHSYEKKDKSKTKKSTDKKTIEPTSRKTNSRRNKPRRTESSRAKSSKLLSRRDNSNRKESNRPESSMRKSDKYQIRTFIKSSKSSKSKSRAIDKIKITKKEHRVNKKSKNKCKTTRTDKIKITKKEHKGNKKSKNKCKTTTADKIKRIKKEHEVGEKSRIKCAPIKVGKHVCKKHRHLGSYHKNGCRNRLQKSKNS